MKKPRAMDVLFGLWAVVMLFCIYLIAKNFEDTEAPLSPSSSSIQLYTDTDTGIQYYGNRNFLIVRLDRAGKPYTELGKDSEEQILTRGSCL